MFEKLRSSLSNRQPLKEAPTRGLSKEEAGVRRFFLFTLLLLTGLNLEAQKLPPDAQALLNTFPEKAVTFEVVLERAIKKSDSFEALRVEQRLVDLPKLEAEALTYLNLTASTNYLDDQREPTNPFSFTRQVTNQYSLGLEKRFKTGTSLQTELGHGKLFFQLPQQGLFPFEPQIYQTTASVTLTQSLLKDSFGASTRRKIQAAELSSEARRLEFEDQVQNWSLELAQAFHDAWLAQENYKASLESLERRQRTLRVTRIKSRRGTSERPDLLQAQAATTDAELMVNDAHLNLEDKWRALVISLKLPKHWLDIDPVLIPLKIQDDTGSAQSSCERVAKTKEPLPSYSLEAMEKLTKASELQLKATKSDKYPAVDLVGSYSLNSVDNRERSETFSEVADGEYPAWSVGVQVTYPLGRPTEEAQYRQAFVNHIQSTNQLQQAKDQLKLTWISLCDRLQTLRRKTNEYAQTVKQQQERERLESRRFNLGRVPLLNVIQSGDDQTRARQNWIEAQANLQLTALRILAIDRKLYTRVKGLIDEEGH